MKQYLSAEDLFSLSETQKDSLRDLWQPRKHDLAGTIIWKDVENDLYDFQLVMIEDIVAQDVPGEERWELNPRTRKYCPISFRVSFLTDPSTNGDEPEESDSVFNDEFDTVNDLGMGPDPEDELPADNYISFDNCLPLFSIGQMIEILFKNQFDFEFSFSFTPEEVMCCINGKVYTGEELCDVLWNVVKTIL